MYLLPIIWVPTLNGLAGNALDMSVYGGPAYTIQLYLRGLITFAIGAGGVYFFIMLILGGYSYITSGSDKDAVQKATARIRNALIGIAILLSIFVILWVVETLFGVSLRSVNVPTLI